MIVFDQQRGFMIEWIKHYAELSYWKKQYKKENQNLQNSWYKDIMLLMAGENDDSFLEGKNVADFGSGPRDTLGWIKSTSYKYALDVLSHAYVKFGINKYRTVYPVVTEDNIALPDQFIDVLFCMNALDHVAHLEKSCAEILRIMKKGSWFIGSFNINEKFNWSEPQTLTEEKLEHTFLKHFNVVQTRRSVSAGTNSVCDNFNNITEVDMTKPYYLWIKAQMK